MSIYDPYLELELYLEKAQDDIVQSLERKKIEYAESNRKELPIHPKFLLDLSSSSTQSQNDLDWRNIDTILSYFQMTIESDISELWRRHHMRRHSLDDDLITIKQLQDDTLPNQTNLLGKGLSNANPGYDINSTSTTGTQTSPSVSSTNLTYWSDGSSSLYETSISSDVQEEDAASYGSVERAPDEQQETFWTSRCNPPWHQDLAVKSSSAPILKEFVANVNKQTRSQSDRHLSEIEATEACKWLRAAGFPQYAQMYEDQQFPVDVAAAEQDHPLLEPCVLHSLFRRLQALNRCARAHQQRIQHTTDDSEDEQCALSDNWTYQSDLRRWSRTRQNLQIPNLDELTSNINRQKGDTVEVVHDAKDKLRRAGSSKYRRRINRDGLWTGASSTNTSGDGSNMLDLLSKQLNSLQTVSQPGSDTECPSPSPSRYATTRRHSRKTKSLDKTENAWSNSPSHSERIPWQMLSRTDEGDEYNDRRLDLEEGGRSISSLSCSQLQVLRKLALLKLTALMEKYCPTHRSGWNWDLPKFIQKIKPPSYREKSVFGVPLTVILQRTGSAMPSGIEEALQWLQQTAYDQVGLFRKSGVKSRIQHLKMMIENQRDCLNFSEHQSYDIADMVKQYFRELPEALLTNKLSETFILIFQFVPEEEKRQAVLCALLLMPDEHTEVLQSLLTFLSNISEHAEVNQMSDSNLAVCFAPSLFYYNQVPSNRQGLGSPHPKELAENKAAHDCLLYFLRNSENLFNIPKELLKQCTSHEINESCAVQLEELGASTGGNWKEYLRECQNMLLREAREKGWMLVQNCCPNVEISYKKVADGHPLRLWRICAEVEAPPGEVLFRILRERPKWDEELHSTRTVAQLDRNAEVFQYTRRNIVPLPLEDYCVVRTWRTDLAKGACLIVETSVEHLDAANIPNSKRGIVLASRYLIEPCGSGRSRLMHLSRVDTRGRMPEWYHKNYGHIGALHIANIQNSFKQNTTGPESKV